MIKPVNTSRYRRGTCRAMLLLLAFLIAYPAMALEPYSATYKVSRGRMTVGESRYELRISDAGEVHFRSEAKTRGFISLFRSDEIVEESRLRLDAGHLVALEYEYRHTRGRRTEEYKHIEFDWEAGVAISRVDDEEYRLALDPGVVDRMSLQLRIMQDGLADKQTFVYRAIDEDKLEEYVFTIEDVYRLETEAGDFDTVRIQREHGDRTTIFWLAPEFGYVPVRVDQRREDHATISMELEEISGPLVSPATKDLPNSPDADRQPG